jgi:hypothetical protein
MHHAPAVSYPVGRSVLYDGLLVLMLVLGGLALSVWFFALDERHPGHVFVLVVVAGMWLWALRARRQQPKGLLRWDGAAWTIHTGQQVRTVSVQVVLDLQHHLLLCLQPVEPRGPVIWVWPVATQQRDRWLALRQALFAPKPATPASR